MISFLNIGPGRSGTTSFYSMCKKHPQINTGKLQEPSHNGYDLFDTEKYLEHWNYSNIDKNQRVLLLDASSRFTMVENIIHFKKYLSPYVNKFQHVCLVRDLKKFYISVIYYKIILNCDITEIDLKNVEKLLDFKVNDEMYNHIKSRSLTDHMLSVRNVFNEDEIFILPIEFFNEYKVNLFNFLEIDYIDLKYCKRNNLFTELGSINKLKIEPKNRILFLKLYSLIENRVEKNKILNELLSKELKMVDKLCNTKLYHCYQRRN